MARALIIGKKEIADIRAAYDRANARPISWEVLQHAVTPLPAGSNVLTLDSRKPGQLDRPQSEQVLIPDGYRMAISIEQQPSGLIAHFSFSVEGGRPGAMPNPSSVEMLLDVLGFDFRKADELWQEEFLVDGKPGGLAINVVFMLDPSEAAPVAGHA